VQKRLHRRLGAKNKRDTRALLTTASEGRLRPAASKKAVCWRCTEIRFADRHPIGDEGHPEAVNDGIRLFVIKKGKAVSVVQPAIIRPAFPVSIAW
jgi:hypothetical protein